MKISNTSERLKELMVTDGLRQVDILNKCKPFCDKFNVRLGRNDISQYISGKVVPSQQKLSILAKALDADETWLMGYGVFRNNAEKEHFHEMYESYTTKQLIEIYQTFGYDYYKIVEVYHSLSSDGKNEMKMFTDYLINKYQIQDKVSSEKDMESLYFVDQ